MIVLVSECPPGRDVRLADSGASMHITRLGSGMFDCVTANNEEFVVADGSNLKADLL